MIPELAADTAAAAWWAHLDACPTCKDVAAELACATGQRLVFALELAEETDDGLHPEMHASDLN